MLEIRKEQMEVFEKVAIKTFEDGTIEYLRDFVPKHCDALGEERLRDIIRYGWDRAKGYNLTSESSVRIYIGLMFMLGSDFDMDFQLPWAEKILKDESITDETIRIDGLYDEAMYYLDQVDGEENEHIDEVLYRMSQGRFDELSESATGEMKERIASWLHRFFPEKYEYVGEDCISQLIQRGIESANGYGITGERGVTIYTGLMLLLGSRFDTDPQFPWASAVLKDKTIADQSQSVGRLHAEAIANLENWLA